MRKPNTLTNLIDYTIKQNPRGVQKLANSYGELPYNYREPIKNYLKKVCLNIVKNEGIEALLVAHPDRNLFKTKFESEFVNAQKLKADKSTLSNLENKAESKPQTTTEPFNHFKQVPFSRFTSPHNDYSNFFGVQQNEEQDNSQKIALWVSGIVVLIMLSFFLMHILTKK